jgi:hypothetical protein
MTPRFIDLSEGFILPGISSCGSSGTAVSVDIALNGFYNCFRDDKDVCATVGSEDQGFRGDVMVNTSANKNVYEMATTAWN